MTAQEMIKAYRISLHNGDTLRVSNVERAQKDNALAAIKAAKQEIIDILNAEADEAARAIAERKAKIAGIKGLDELRSLISAWDTYRYQWNRFIANDAIGKAPTKPDTEVSELEAKYPRAAAYIKAERFNSAANDAKALAGKRAMERILNSEPHDDVLADMEAEWQAHCDAHIWD